MIELTRNKRKLGRKKWTKHALLNFPVNRIYACSLHFYQDLIHLWSRHRNFHMLQEASLTEVLKINYSKKEKDKIIWPMTAIIIQYKIQYAK